MGRRGPKPSENPGKSIGAHVDGDTLAHLEDVTFTRKRSQSFIAAEAIRLGLPLVEEEYPALRKSKKKPAKATVAKKAGAKKESAASVRRSADLSATLRRKVKAAGLK